MVPIGCPSCADLDPLRMDAKERKEVRKVFPSVASDRKVDAEDHVTSVASLDIGRMSAHRGAKVVLLQVPTRLVRVDVRRVVARVMGMLVFSGKESLFNF